jgi:transposase
MSMREIAERFGVSLQVIKYFFKKQRRLADG